MTSSQYPCGPANRSCQANFIITALRASDGMNKKYEMFTFELRMKRSHERIINERPSKLFSQNLLECRDLYIFQRTHIQKYHSNRALGAHLLFPFQHVSAPRIQAHCKLNLIIFLLKSAPTLTLLPRQRPEVGMQQCILM